LDTTRFQLFVGSRSTCPALGTVLREFFDRESTRFVIHCVMPIGFFPARSAHMTVTLLFSGQGRRPIVG
jgi:hypothetical protein